MLSKSTPTGLCQEPDIFTAKRKIFAVHGNQKKRGLFVMVDVIDDDPQWLCGLNTENRYKGGRRLFGF